jgi:hypothetical protein
MKKIIKILGAILFASFILNNCDSNSATSEAFSSNSENILEIKKLSEEFLGNYQGIQPNYFMKNEFGDHIIIAGNKIPVPSSDFKFLIKENNVVRLQQTNLEDNKQYYYDGNYKIITENSELIKTECSLNNGQGSSPTYFLEISKDDKSGKCTNQGNEPEFTITKIQ